MIQQRTILTVGVDPSYCSLTFDRTDCEIVVMADTEAALDELWQHERQVIAVAVRESSEPDSGLSTLVEVLERHWPDIELLLVPPTFKEQSVCEKSDALYPNKGFDEGESKLT